MKRNSNKGNSPPKTVLFSALIVIIVTICAFCSHVLGEEQKQEPVTVKLKAQKANKAATRMLSPAWANRKNHFGFNSDRGSIQIAGQDVLVQGKCQGRSRYIGVDCDGDGSISKKEFAKIGNNGTCSFSGKAGDTKYDIILWDLTVWGRNGKASYVSGRALMRSCHKGNINGVKIHLFDEDMSGRYDQSGSDSILIGNSSVALPLKRIHLIGKTFYRLEVASDGSSITATPLKDLETGLVTSQCSDRVFKCLVLESDEGAFDIKTSQTEGIPAGEYQLSYGIVSSKSNIPIRPQLGQVTRYKVTAKMRNELRIGLPLTVQFSASLSGDKISVRPNFKILGVGGEEYGPFDYSRRGDAGRPSVMIASGSKILSRGSMGYG